MMRQLILVAIIACALSSCIVTSQSVSTGTLLTEPPTNTNFDGSAPWKVSIVDWTDETAPVTRGTFNFDTQQPELTFEHPWMAQQMQSTSVMTSSASVIWGEFEFGGMMTAQAPSFNAENELVPVYQVLVGAKPYGRWPTYPARRTWNKTTDVSHPPPFKVEIRNFNDVLIHTIQMADGIAINSPRLPQKRDLHVALRPLWHCGQLLKYQNAKAKASSNMNKWIAGYTSDSIRPTQAKQSHSSVAPIGYGGFGALMATQSNAINQWFAMPKRPLGWSTIYNATHDPSVDPYLYPINAAYPPYYNSIYGYGYEPGQPGGHDHLVAPGGPRVERGPMATPYAIYSADPNWKRLKDNEPIRELVEHWGDNYFNHGQSTHIW